MQISIENLSFSYADTEGIIFQNFSLAPQTFRRMALLGVSGVGKSTLLRLLSGCLEPQVGAVNICGTSGRRPRFGYVSQEDALLPWLSVQQGITLAARLSGNTSDRRPESDVQLLSALGLDQNLRSLPYQLSGGMKKRAAVAASLLSGAELHLFDEPFAGSDRKRRAAMHAAIRSKCDELQRAVIFTTHDALDVVELADTVLWLSDAAGRSPTVIDATEGWTPQLRMQLAELMLGEAPA